MSLRYLDVLSKHVQGLGSTNLGSKIITLRDSCVIETVKAYDISNFFPKTKLVFLGMMNKYQIK